MSPEQVLNDWQTYLDNYAANLQRVKNNTDNVVNSPTATATEKSNARRVYSMQLAHYQELSAKFAYIQSYYSTHGVLPDNVSFGADGSVASFTYKTAADSAIYNGYARKSAIGTSTVVAEHFQIVFVADTNNFEPFTDDYHYGIKCTTGGNLHVECNDPKQYLQNTSQTVYVYTNYTFVIAVNSAINVDIIPRGTTALSHTFYNGLWVTMPTDTVDTSSPWDYYNNDLLPAIKNIIPNPTDNDAVFPDEYNPDIIKPDPDFPDLNNEQENTGDDIELNDPTETGGIGGSLYFTTQYVLAEQDLAELGRLLWSGFRSGSQADIDAYLQNFVYNVNTDTGSVNMADVMNFFVSLKAYPFPIYYIQQAHVESYNLYIGAGTSPLVMSRKIGVLNSYYGKLDCGSVTLPFLFGDYRDYACEITLYAPYCGTVQLNPADVMGGTISCIYAIDFCTGGCLACFTVKTWDGKTFPIAQIPGQIAADIPLTAGNAGRIASRILSDRVLAVENMVSIAKNTARGLGAVASGNFATAADSAFGAFIESGLNEQKQLAAIGSRGAIAAPVLGTGGGFTSFSTAKRCYVQIRSPFYSVPDNYADTVGLSAAKSVTIGDCTGFCQFVNVNVSGLQIDKNDQIKIKQILESGIYI